MARSIFQFNQLLDSCIRDVKEMNVLSDKDISMIENMLSILKFNNNAIIRNFQLHVLKDELVYHILKSDTDYFMNYNIHNLDISKGIPVKESDVDMICKLQETIRNLVQESGQEDNIRTVFLYLQKLCYFAYEDLKIDASVKFTELLNSRN